MNTSNFSGLYALLWSWKQKSFHIEQIDVMLEKNLEAFKNKYPVDFIPLAFTSDMRYLFLFMEFVIPDQCILDLSGTFSGDTEMLGCFVLAAMIRFGSKYLHQFFESSQVTISGFKAGNKFIKLRCFFQIYNYIKLIHVLICEYGKTFVRTKWNWVFSPTMKLHAAIFTDDNVFPIVHIRKVTQKK